ncbi:MAG: enoyl-CoA hydratase/isomerase family protein [Bacteroidia bacterium]
MAQFQFLKNEQQQNLQYITLNRPEKRNALNDGMVAELKQALHEAAENPSVRVIILRGEGKAFSAGADLAYLQQLQQNTLEDNIADSTHLMELFRQIYFCSKVVVAQVEGHAIAGGCGLATVCDFIFSVPEAQFGYTEVRIGFVPAIVMFFLIRKIGEAKARELLLTGKLISATEAANRFGIVNEVVDAGRIAQHVRSFSEDLARDTSPASIEITRRMIAEIQHEETMEALTYAAQNNARARETEDCKRGIAAFLNKTKIEWK